MHMQHTDLRFRSVEHLDGSVASYQRGERCHDERDDRKDEATGDIIKVEDV